MDWKKQKKKKKLNQLLFFHNEMFSLKQPRVSEVPKTLPALIIKGIHHNTGLRLLKFGFNRRPKPPAGGRAGGAEGPGLGPTTHTGAPSAHARTRSIVRAPRFLPRRGNTPDPGRGAAGGSGRAAMPGGAPAVRERGAGPGPAARPPARGAVGGKLPAAPWGGPGRRRGCTKAGWGESSGISSETNPGGASAPSQTGCCVTSPLTLLRAAAATERPETRGGSLHLGALAACQPSCLSAVNSPRRTSP